MVKALGDVFLIGGAGDVGGQGAAAALLTTGKVVTVWTNQAMALDPIAGVSDRDFSVVLGRIMRADGTGASAVFQINTSAVGPQNGPEVLALSGGRFVVSWTDGPRLDTGAVEARAQLFAADGSKIGAEIRLASVTAGDQMNPRLVATKGGDDFMAYWLDDRPGYDNGYVARHFDGATGARIGNELTVLNTGPVQVEFIRMSDGSYRFIDTNIFPTALKPMAAAPTYMQMTGFGDFNSFVGSGTNWDSAALSDNRFALVGELRDAFTHKINVKLQVYSGDNQPLTDGFDRQIYAVANVNRVEFPFTANSDAQVHKLRDGGLLVVWVQPTGTEGVPNYNIMAQQFDRELYAIGGNVLIHKGTAGNQYAPRVTDAPDGKVLITWTSNAPVDGGNPIDVYGRLFRLSTAGEWSVTPSTQNDRLIGTAANNTIHLLDGRDYYDGKGGNDQVYGGNYDDWLLGGDGNDTMWGESGVDVLVGGAGNDKMVGSYDADWAVFTGTSKITVNLSLTTAQATGQGRDILQEIENVRSGAGNDLLIGNILSNRLEGMAGNDTLKGGDAGDTLRGGSGNDKLYGGLSSDELGVDRGNDLVDGGNADGNAFVLDRLIYLGAADGVVNLATGQMDYAGLGDDTIRGIEMIYSGDGDDRLTGSAADENFQGGAGRDTIDGGAGNDVIDGDGRYGLGSVIEADRIIFRTGGDSDVARFNNDLDTLALDVVGIKTVAQALAKATDILSAVVFDFGNGDVIRIDYMTKAQMADDVLIL